MRVEIEGIEALLARLQETERDVEAAKEKALMKSGEFMQEKVKENARQRTGTLKENIEVKKNMQGDEVEVFVDQQGPAFYGYFLEIVRRGGVVKRGRYRGKRIPPMPAYPFMGPAYENNKGRITDIMADEIRRELGLL